MDILWLNWRDLRHPRAGGAEIYTHEVARRLVSRGHNVTLFVAAVRGAPADDWQDGVRIVRRGNAITTRLLARRWLKRSSSTFDAVLEEINTLPYGARRWSGVPTLLLVHQIAREVWWWEAPWFLAPLGRIMEPVMLRAVRGPTIALSSSTKEDLCEVGFRRDAIRVVHPGLSRAPVFADASSVDRGTFIYVGRLAASKRVDDVIRALAILRRSGRDARLVIIGQGTRVTAEHLKRIALTEEVAECVRFRGFVATEERDRLLASATAVVMASVREGWGMSVTEANAVGTPSVVYDRPGLRDSTVHGQTGLVTSPDPVSLATAMAQLMDDAPLRERLAVGARSWAQQLTWEATTDAVEDGLRQVTMPGQLFERTSEARR